jgi:hypothetical protein
MKRVFGILATGVLAACGSSSSNNNGTTPPTPTTYSYGSGTPVQAGSGQQTAAGDAQTNTTELVNATQSGSVSSNAQTLSTAPELPNTIIADLGDQAVALKNPAFSVAGKLSRAQRNGSIFLPITDSSCYTVNNNTITYNNCQLNDSAEGITETVNGTLTASATSLTWNINETLTFNNTSDNENFNFQGTATGNLNFTVTSTDVVINGTATDAFSGSFSGSGTTENFAYTAQVVFKSFDISNTCDPDFGAGPISGAFDVSVTAVASNGSAASVGYENFGYEFSWQGCDKVYVAVGTAG